MAILKDIFNNNDNTARIVHDPARLWNYPVVHLSLLKIYNLYFMPYKSRGSKIDIRNNIDNMNFARDFLDNIWVN